MATDGKDARRRMRDAALELFQERGFDKVTAAQIAERAGVVRRTFFRHFADKRDVLFEEEALRDALLAGVAAAPAGARPLEMMRASFHAAAPVLEENRASAELRRAVIAGHPALTERANAKSVALVAMLASALEARGVAAMTARLAAKVGMAACQQAVACWHMDLSQPFSHHLDHAFADLHRLLEQR